MSQQFFRAWSQIRFHSFFIVALLVAVVIEKGYRLILLSAGEELFWKLVIAGAGAAVISYFLSCGRRRGILSLLLLGYCEWLYSYGASELLLSSCFVGTGAYCLASLRRTDLQVPEAFRPLLVPVALFLGSALFFWPGISLSGSADTIFFVLGLFSAIGVFFLSFLISSGIGAKGVSASSKYHSTPDIALLSLCFVGVGAWASATQLHEYLYYFSGALEFTIHPEYSAAILFVSVTVIVALLREICVAEGSSQRMIMAGAFSIALILLAFSFPSYDWDSLDPLYLYYLFSDSQSYSDLLFGYGPDWRDSFSQDLLVGDRYHLKQFPLNFPAVNILVFGIGGIITSLLFLWFWCRFLAGVQGVTFVCAATLALVSFILPSLLSLPAIVALGGMMGMCSPQVLPWAVSRNAPRRFVYPRIRRAFFSTGILLLVLLMLNCIWIVRKEARFRTVPVSPDKISTCAGIIVAAEDVLFFRHQGIDFARLKWVTRDALVERKFSRGASTITMQLVKMLYLSYEPTLLRKGEQLLLAIAADAIFSKEEILGRYLSTLDFANGAIGIEAAALKYYGKRMEDLSREECIVLAASIPNPYFFNPSITPVPGEAKRSMLAISRRYDQFKESY